MSRTRSFSLIRKYLKVALDAERRGIPAREAVERAEAFALTRRQLLAAASAAPIIAACGDDTNNNNNNNVAPKIAIVGGGTAGLHAGYLLKKRGLDAKIFEAANRTGGRMFTARGKLADDQIVELGGELIDTGHTIIQGLATELGLQLDDLSSEPADISKDTFFFDGRLVTPAEIVEMFGPLAMKMSETVTAAEADDMVFESTDAQSIEAWLGAQADLDPLMKKILMISYTGEYGLEPDQQSIFNLLYLIDYETTDEFKIFGDSDERYHLHTGSGSIPEKLAADLGARIETDRRLVRISESGTKIKLALDRAGTTTEEEFDHVVLALPFSVLRDVDIQMELPDTKKRAIQELGYGTNAKLMSQYNRRVWREDHKSNGSTFTDNGIQSTWETSRGQTGASGVLTNFVGGQDGLDMGSGTPEDQMQARLPKLDQIWAGTKDAYRANSAIRMHWPTHEFTKGSYACYKPGQWAFFGTEKARVKNLHFAGEHTSEDFQGYMEGAAESGKRAADEILADLNLTTTGTLRVRRRGPR